MKKYILATAIATLTCSSYAQNGINSPYSRYGFGLLSERSVGFNKGMGGVAQGFRNGQQINISNPASYSEVDSLTSLFDIGITLQNGNYKMGNMQQNVKNSSFDYFAFQFRAAKNVGITVGMMPISNIKYNFASQKEVLDGTENVASNYSYSGDGGLREVILGAGWRPIKPISIGANLSYVWGDYSHAMTMSYNESSTFNLQRLYNTEISTYNAQVGLQYAQPISKNDKIVLGATYTFGHDINADATRATQMTSASSSTMSGQLPETQTIDTIQNAFQFPTSIAVGLTYYHSDRLRAGLDFELQKWSECLFPTEIATSNGSTYTSVTNVLNDRKKVALGLDWTPNPYSRGSYFKRMTYKVGGYYSQSYANADLTGKISDKPYEFGVSAGFSMPIKNRNLIFDNSSKINFAVQWVHTNIPYLNSASMAKSTLTENYLRICLGVTINEHWFYKWKLE